MLSSSELRLLIELLSKHIESQKHPEKTNVFLVTLRDKLLRKIKC